MSRIGVHIVLPRQALMMLLALGALGPTSGALAQPGSRAATENPTMQIAQGPFPPWACAWRWGCPPPPPRPPPPPGPPPPRTRSFIIYFDFDSAGLTPAARSVVHQAAVYATQWHASRVTIVAHTDTSGSQSYNTRLSAQRARVTADGLIYDGVPQETLDLGWRGEVDPAVPTGDEVKEQLNRRAVIIVRY